MTEPNPIHSHCVFKTDVARDRAACLHETAAALMYHMAEWCLLKGWPFVVTDTVSTEEEDRALNRISDTHRTGRAFDVSVHSWTEKMIEEFSEHFEAEWGRMGAIAASNGQPHLIVHHDAGEGDHMHVQLSRVFAIQNPIRH